MKIKILPHQVPRFWETVKFSYQEVEQIPAYRQPAFYTSVLHDLMSHKATLWIRMDENRTLIGLVITRIMADKVMGEKYMRIDTIYSWKKLEIGEWETDLMTLYEFAKQQECSYIQSYSSNPKILEYVKHLGFKEVARVHNLPVK